MGLFHDSIADSTDLILSKDWILIHSGFRILSPGQQVMGETRFIFQPFHFDDSRDESLFRFSWFPFHENPGQYFLFPCFQLEGYSLAHLPFFISCKNHQVGGIRWKPFVDHDKITMFGPGLVDPPPEGSEKTWFRNNHQ